MNRQQLFAGLIYLALAAQARGAALEDDGGGDAQAFQAAAQRVAPAVVRIETVGGAERIGKLATGSAPTTGLIVSSDGYIVTSAFNLAQKPSSILVTLGDGKRYAARQIATDHNRMLTLLKVDPPGPLPVPAEVPQAEMRVGQWTIAVGRTYDNQRPNLSVGVLSGVNRIWGKAIQTDAKISPANYGGPLVDLEGRVLGVLVPLSPDSATEVAGVEWYDSGIGFAIPLEHINKILPRLKAGEELKSGVLGIALRGDNLFGPAVVGAVRPNSPAYKAGIKAGDEVKGVNDRPIERLAQLRSQLNSRYAGEKVKLSLARGDQTVDVELELVAELQPYEHVFLGLLPLRDEKQSGAGIAIRYVYPDSPAAQAGIVAGDRLVSLAGQPVKSTAEAWEKLAVYEPGQTLAIEFKHGDEILKRDVTLARLPADLPPELPPSHGQLAAGDDKPPQRGRVELKIADFANQTLAYVPESYDPRVASGLVVWLHAPGAYNADELFKQWRDVCERFDLVLLLPKAAGESWQPDELAYVKQAINQVANAYNVDRARIVTAGSGTGGTLAFLVAFANRDLVRGVVTVGGPPAGRLADNEPLERLAIYSAAAKETRFAKQLAAAIGRLRELKYPVTERELGDKERPLSADELLGVGRWIDSLDRI